MAEQFYTILTSIGKAKIANASALGNKVNFTHFALGDGGGKYYNPTESQTELKNEVWRGQIGQISIDEKNPNWIVIETIIPADQGGFMIREAGIFDDEGNLLAVGKYPQTYKPAVENGSAKDLYIRMILEVANTSVVNLKVDPGVILATKKDIEVLEQKMNEEINNIDIPVTEIVDNLTTDDSTKALSARQGKILDESKANISDLEAKMDKGGGTFKGRVYFDDRVYFSGNRLYKPQFLGYAEAIYAYGAVSGNHSIAPGFYPICTMELEGNCSMFISDVNEFGGLNPVTLFISNFGNYSLTFPEKVHWIDGEIPDLTTSGTHVITIMQRLKGDGSGGTSAYICFYGGRIL